MNYPPLFNESIRFSKNLDKIISSLRYSNYKKKYMVNLHYKYDKIFYNAEGELFSLNPDSYLSDDERLHCSNEFDTTLSDRKVDSSLYFKVIIKVFAHFLFRIIGFMQKIFYKSNTSVLRKCYVEDVEALFDQECDVRLIYPFPLSIRRQLKYLCFLNKNSKKFLFDGVPYDIVSFFRFIFVRTYAAMNKLEARGAIRLAVLHKLKFNPKIVQCSDEYEIGSYYYAKHAVRLAITTHNSAHGIGKYLPYTAYTNFDCLSSAQIEYYMNFSLNGVYKIRKMTSNVQVLACHVKRPTVVFLGQYSGRNDYLKNAEIQVLELIKNLQLLYSQKADFLYKPHPNNSDMSFLDLDNVKTVDTGLVYGDCKYIVQFSLFSTCQVDPNFLGHKFLVETDYIKPSISFGLDAEIIKFEKLSDYLSLKINSMPGE